MLLVCNVVWKVDEIEFAICNLQSFVLKHWYTMTCSFRKLQIANCKFILCAFISNGSRIHIFITLQGYKITQMMQYSVCISSVWRRKISYKLSISSSHKALEASEGIRQSPRGLRLTLPTLGPSGRHERLNCCAKKRRKKVWSQCFIVASS